jgi:hypothetical protein
MGSWYNPFAGAPAAKNNCRGRGGGVSVAIAVTVNSLTTASRHA